jgi:ABC-type oligopeptide transport system substrate-binding subunit
LFLWESTTLELNSSSYKSPAFDDLMRQVDREKDVDARGQLLGRATAILLHDLPAVPQFFPYQRPLVKSYILNWIDNPRQANRTRWLDIGPRPEAPEAAGQTSDGSIWDWLGSWFSWDAWAKWWNS